MNTVLHRPALLLHAFRGVLFCLLCAVAAANGRAQSITTDWGAKSLPEIRLGAERGQPVAMRLLANAYLTGEGVPKDPAEAVKWLTKAAEQRDALAQFILGILYQEGRGVARDAFEAAKWYRAAAGQGLPEAQYNLGLCYATGEGTLKDTGEAINWFKKAAEAGDKEAQTRLGLAYITGNGVTQDDAQAANWLRKAAYQYDPIAMFFFGRLYEEGKGVAKEPVDAAKWFRRSAEAGYADAQHALGLCYLTGDGVARDFAQAALWLQKAAAQGNNKAIKQLASMGIAPIKDAALAAPGYTPTLDPAPPRSETPTAAPNPFGATRATELTPSGASFRAEPSASMRTNDNSPATIQARINAALEKIRSGDTSGLASPFRLEPAASPTTPTPSTLADNAANAFKSDTTPGFFSATTSTNAPKEDFTSPRDTGTTGSKEISAATSRDLNITPDTAKKAETLLPPDTGLVRPGARDYVPGAMVGGEERNVNNTIAVAALIMAVVIAGLCVIILITFRTHITSLEMEIKKTQFELSKANVNLSAMIKQVEALSLGGGHTNAKQIELPDWLKDKEEEKSQRAAPKSSGFKAKR
ncbi:MAG: SEL1-like repeat protein [Verrucomicrobia bacterium]|nr:SEL1-like repeat protein [Verrucomicrobiota bacterium]